MMNKLVAATSTFEGPAIQWFKISPILALLGGALLLILVGSLTPQWKRGWYAAASVATAVTAAVLTGVLWSQMGDDKPSTLVGGAISFDHFALFATFTICVGLLLSRSLPTTISLAKTKMAQRSMASSSPQPLVG